MYPQTTNTRKRLILIGLAILATILVILVVQTSNSNNIDVLPEEGTSADYKSQVVFTASKESRELLTKLGGVVQSDSLAQDLYVFAKESYQEYKGGTGIVIGFKITSEVKLDNGTVTFSGRFGATKNEINVTAKILPNSRLKTSITDKNTGKTTEVSLPSNSKRNQVISELPMRDNQFYISYDKTGDVFVINIYDGGTSALDIATNALAQKLGVKDLGKERFSVLRSGGGGVLSPKPVVDNHADEDYE